MPRPSSSLRRKRPSKELEEVHWIFCEGKTEADCLNKLRQHWRVATARIQVVGQVGVPSTIVAKAKAKKRDLKRSGFPDTVHVVFDEDEHPKFRQSVQQARDFGISAGISVPCFELWAILLHQDQTAHIERGKAQRLLKQCHPDYCHRRHPYLDLKSILNGLENARERSKLLAQRATEKGDALANPTSTFSKVVDAVFPQATSPNEA